jgi:arginyl-tRNA synthetase
MLRPMIEATLIELLREALASTGLEVDAASVAIELSKPRQKELGDFATISRSRRQTAPAAAAGGGRRDRRRVPHWAGRVRRVRAPVHQLAYNRGSTSAASRSRSASFGRTEQSRRRMQIEFAARTRRGFTLGHARNAAMATLARLFEFTGWQVGRVLLTTPAARWTGSRERQASTQPGASRTCPRTAITARTSQSWRRTSSPRRAVATSSEQASGPLRDEGARRILDQIRSTLDVRLRSSITRSLAERGEIEAAVERLRAAGAVYDAEGAVWFRSTDHGDDKDRPLLRSNGLHTYFGADCAYLIDKFERGFDHLVYVWGADHHGDIARVRGAAEALGYGGERAEFVIYQWVSFLRDGVPVPMSKRAGTFVTLDELIDEVGTDAARFHLLMFGSDAAMSFDIDAVKRQSLENPVYYVQYGHARIASILRKAAERGVEVRPIAEADLSLLRTEPEHDVLRAIADVPAQVAAAAEFRAPHRLTHAAQDLAARFHRFYTECPVLSEDAALTQARLWLCRGAEQAIANLLGLLGVSAPEAMDRADA